MAPRKLLVPALLLAATVGAAAPADRWLHVRVQNTGERKENVRINIPLALAEKVLPAIKINRIQNGKLKMGDHGVSLDPRALLDAVRSTADGEFVSVEGDRESVRVAKEAGYLLVKVREGPNPEKKKTHNVDVRIPFTVVEALLSGDRDELDILAAVRALSSHGDLTLVTVNNKSETVRIWVDSRNSAD